MTTTVLIPTSDVSRTGFALVGGASVVACIDDDVDSPDNADYLLGDGVYCKFVVDLSDLAGAIGTVNSITLQIVSYRSIKSNYTGSGRLVRASDGTALTDQPSISILGFLGKTTAVLTPLATITGDDLDGARLEFETNASPNAGTLYFSAASISVDHEDAPVSSGSFPVSRFIRGRHMASDIPQNSTEKFQIFMADSTDVTAAKTGLTSFTVKLAQPGTAEATVSPTIVERGGGWYEVTPGSTHRNLQGWNAWTFSATGAVVTPYGEHIGDPASGTELTNVAHAIASKVSMVENLCASSSDATDWTEDGATVVDSQTDPFGGSNAIRINNASTASENHRAYAGSSTAGGCVVTIWAKGTAGSVGCAFTAGTIVNYDIGGDSFTAADGNATLVSATTVDGWTKLVISFNATGVGTETFQVFVDAPSASTIFAPANTTNYLDVLSHITAAANGNQFVATTGTAIAAHSVQVPTPAVQAEAMRQELDDNSTKLQNLDATISSRLANAGYTAPDNAGIASVLLDTDWLQQLIAELVTGSSPNRQFTATALGNASGVTQANIDAIVAAVQAVGSSIAAAVASSTLTIDQAEYTTLTISGLGSLSGRSGLVWQMISRENDSDDKALITVTEAAGLTRLNGTTSGLTAGDAAITIDDVSAGNITITLNSTLTKQLIPGKRFDGVKVLKSAGQDTEPRRGCTLVTPGRVLATAV